ncbi:DUF6134 family protein [Flavobacterium glycines]|nr:DUF6134 family protein [Flavobacterium glycines]
MSPNLISLFFKTATHLKAFISKVLIRFSIKLILFLPIISLSQNSRLDYNVMFSGHNIGWLRLEKNDVGNKSDLLLVSEIKTRLLFPIRIFSKETSTYENGKLIYSSQFRKTNGKTNLNKEIRFVENEYEIVENDKKTKLSCPKIDSNLLSLFFQEPKNSKEVYCDNQQSFIKVSKADDGGYQMKFPNGNYNCYYYKEGICVKVKMQHKFYIAEIIIKY